MTGSNYLEELIAKATKGDLWETKFRPPAKTERNSVHADSFDKQAWLWIEDMIPVLKGQVDDLGDDFETSPWAYEDLFNLLNRADPEAVPADLLLDEFKPQAHMMSLIGGSEELRHLRHETVLDEYNTAYAMLTMRDKMRKAFENLQEAIEAAQAASDAMAQALQDAQDALASGEGMQEAGQALMDAMAAAGAAMEAGESEAEGAASSMMGAAEQAADQIQAQRSLMSAYGVGKGDLQRMSFEERRALAERLDQGRLSSLAKMIGAQRMSADAERRRSVKKAPTRTADMRLGNDLSQLLPSDAVKMAIPEFEEDFWLRFHKKRLRLKQWQDPPELDRGPMIVVCDESASMGAQLDNLGNTREAWSKAISLALCDQARRGKRDFVYIGFASIGEQWVTQFEKGVTPIEKVVEFTEHFLCGGTHYETPLTTAMNICLEYAKAGKPKPDIVFITDDQCRVSAEFVEAWAADREKAQVRCYGIQIGASAGYDTMRGLTDQCMEISALNASPEGVTELFRSL